MTAVPRRPSSPPDAGVDDAPEPPRRGWADLLRLIGDTPRLTCDTSLDDANIARRIRDRFGEYDSRFDNDR